MGQELIPTMHWSINIYCHCHHGICWKPTFPGGRPCGPGAGGELVQELPDWAGRAPCRRRRGHPEGGAPKLGRERVFSNSSPGEAGRPAAEASWQGLGNGQAGDLVAGSVGGSLQPTMEPAFPSSPEGQSPRPPEARDPRRGPGLLPQPPLAADVSRVAPRRATGTEEDRPVISVLCSTLPGPGEERSKQQEEAARKRPPGPSLSCRPQGFLLPLPPCPPLPLAIPTSLLCGLVGSLSPTSPCFSPTLLTIPSQSS